MAVRYGWRTGSHTRATLKTAGSDSSKGDDGGTSIPTQTTCMVQLAKSIDLQNMWSKKCKQLLFWNKTPEMSENLMLKPKSIRDLHTYLG